MYFLICIRLSEVFPISALFFFFFAKKMKKQKHRCCEHRGEDLPEAEQVDAQTGETQAEVQVG